MQELLAPEHVVFYDRNWIELGSRSFLKHEISEATRISPEHMKRPRSASVATKMAWASTRETSREEDIAYSLLGLFDINMPLIYGEGTKAFFRLQSEIIRTSSDESIYAWADDALYSSGLLAPSPRAFRNSSDIVPMEGLNSLSRSPPYMTNRGIAIQIVESRKPLKSMDHSHLTLTVPLNCAKASQREHSFKLHLQRRGRQAASRINVDRIEFYGAKVPEDNITSKSVFLYVENTNESMELWKLRERIHVVVTLTLAAQNLLVTFKHLMDTPDGLIHIFNNGEVRRSQVFVPEQATLWYRFHHGFEFVLAWQHRADEGIPEIRIYTSNSIRRSPLSVEFGRNDSPMNILRQLPSPTSILSEPYDSTTLPLGNGEFLWIKTELRQGGWSRPYNVHIDITSIDRSMLLLKTHRMEESE